MEVVGEKFNPELHEAVGQVENSEQNSDIIIEEIRTGFYFMIKCYRPRA